MKSKILTTTASLVAILLMTPTAHAKGKGGGGGGGKGKGGAKPQVEKKVKPTPNKQGGPKIDKKPDNKPGKPAKEWREAGKFADKDRNELAAYWDRYKGNDNGLPPGLAKNLRKGKPLPPGWEKKIRNGWVVEDDWWGMFDRVPSTDLPKNLNLPKDTGMFLFGDRMVRVHEPTREVIDFVKMPNVKP